MVPSNRHDRGTGLKGLVESFEFKRHEEWREIFTKQPVDKYR